MVKEDCPNTLLLEELLLGRLSDDDAAPLEDHLAQCAECAAKAQTIRPHDTLVDAMREYQPPAAGDDELARRMAQRLFPCSETPDPDPASTDSTQDASAQAGLYARLANVLRPDEGNQAELAESDPASLYDFLAPPQADDELGRLGNYRVLEVLGAGGMGVVFLAEDLDLKRLVALKAMHPALAASANARERFMRKAQAAAAIDHDHVVTIHQVGKDRGIPFLAMTLLRGQSVDDRILPGRPLPLADVLRIGQEAAAGLAAAHARGLVHRDVKPANIWLEEGTGRVKLLDFGLARQVDSDTHLTRVGAVVGTPAFMSPEQARGETLDVRGDLFSLGCALYLMSTGEAPFIGVDHAAVMAAVERETPAAPKKLRPTLPAELSELIMRLLEKDREQRPQSADEVAQALREIESTLAQPKPTAAADAPRNPRPTTPRRRNGFLYTAVALLLLAGGCYLAYTVIVKSRNGHLIVKADNKDVEITIKHTGEQPIVHVVDRQTQREIDLKPGQYEVEVTIKDGKQQTIRRRCGLSQSLSVREHFRQKKHRNKSEPRLFLCSIKRAPIDGPTETALLGYTGIGLFSSLQQENRANHYMLANNVVLTQRSFMWCVRPARAVGLPSPPRNVSIQNNIVISDEDMKGIDFQFGDD